MDNRASRSSSFALAGIALSALTLASVLGRAVAEGATRGADHDTRRWVRRRRSAPLTHAAKALTRIGEPATQLSLAVIAGVALARRPHASGPRIAPRSPRAVLTASAPMLAALSAIAAHRTIKLVYDRKRPLGARLRGKRESSFPSGHAAVTSATIGMVAYHFSKRGFVSPAVARVAAVIPFGVGLSRIYLDDHWVTDVVAGWLVGAGLSAAGAAMFELER